MPYEFNDIRLRQIEDRVPNPRCPIRTKHSTKLISCEIRGVQKCGKQLATVGSFASILCASNQCIETLIKRERDS